MEQGILEAVSLATMAVHPKYQRQGIGSALVRQGLEFCRESDESIVVLVGHPEYYPRFGFSAELAKNLHGPFSGEVWMVDASRRLNESGSRGIPPRPCCSKGASAAPGDW